MSLAKAEEGKNCQNHNDETDEIDKSVHSLLPCTAPLLTDNLLVPAKFPSSRKNVQCLGCRLRVALITRPFGFFLPARVDAVFCN